MYVVYRRFRQRLVHFVSWWRDYRHNIRVGALVKFLIIFTLIRNYFYVNFFFSDDAHVPHRSSLHGELDFELCWINSNFICNCTLPIDLAPIVWCKSYTTIFRKDFSVNFISNHDKSNRILSVLALFRLIHHTTFDAVHMQRYPEKISPCDGSFDNLMTLLGLTQVFEVQQRALKFDIHRYYSINIVMLLVLLYY